MQASIQAQSIVKPNNAEGLGPLAGLKPHLTVKITAALSQTRLNFKSRGSAKAQFKKLGLVTGSKIGSLQP